MHPLPPRATPTAPMGGRYMHCSEPARDEPFKAGPRLHRRRRTHTQMHTPLSSPSWARKTHLLYLVFSLLNDKN